MQYINLEETVYFWFGANDTSGSGNDGASAVYDVRLGGAASSAAPTLSGNATLLSHADYPAGAYEIAVAATSANGFAVNGSYAVFCTLAVDSQNPTGFVGAFRTAPVLAKVGENNSAVERTIAATDQAEFIILPKTGLVAADLTISYSRGESDNDFTVTDVTSSLNDLSALTDAHNDWGLKEVSATLAPRLYRLDLADAVYASGAKQAVISAVVTESGEQAEPLKINLSTPLTLTEIGDAARDSTLNATAASFNTAGSIGALLNALGDPWSVTLPGSYSTNTAGWILGTRIDASVSSRAASDTALSTADWTATRAGYLDVLASLNSNLSDLANNVNSTLVAAQAVPTADQNADALLGRNIAGGSSTGRTVYQALAFLRNKWVLGGGGDLTVYEVDDSSVLWTAVGTLSSGGQLSSLDPVS